VDLVCRSGSAGREGIYYSNTSVVIMLNRYLYITYLIFMPALCFPQAETKIIDTLKQQLILASDDSSRISIMQRIGFYYEALNADSSVKYTRAALAYARKHSRYGDEARLMAGLSSVLRQQGKFTEALDLLYKSLKIAQENNLTRDIARAYRRLGLVYYDLENFPKALDYFSQAVEMDEESENKRSAAIDHLFIGDAYEKMDKLDSAAFHIDIAFKQKDGLDLTAPDIFNINGNIQLKKENYDQALLLYKDGYKLAQKNDDLVVSSKICAGLAVLFKKINKRDSAIFYALKGFKFAQDASFQKGIILSGRLLSELYDSKQPVEALKYFRIAAAAKDSVFGVTNIQTIQDFVAREQARQKEMEDAQVSYSNKLKIYGLVTGLAGLMIIAFILYRNNSHKKRANVLLHMQKDEIEATLSELKSTQSQLIQSEKMASLGELTAGIAHEIQNPLNFVNNFSEVSNELIAEMNGELEKGEVNEAKAIAKDVKENLEKINHHGKRAADIVKGMLQHSRASSGQKESTDINTLCDEYLRLSYHGLRAKNKSFNAKFETDFDASLPKINVVPQDIGRVVLNLINNAFYAVSERSKLQASSYQPQVTVSTKKAGDKVLISVKDNGNGIPQNIVDKIFQPFFTTKPTGQGTGLGLSLSYDIVKAHGGAIEVKSTENGIEFIVKLPV
jgi:two-component system, NtrC family, sensor kinase